jgi:2-keto-4-pentenoate hydratase/2-oxohepta-3-ene-1,7-dioic acid hydratase in catechol pathway
LRLISFEKDRQPSYGVLAGARIHDLGGRFGGEFPTLRSAIAGNLFARRDLVADAPVLGRSEIDLLTPLPDAGKIICIGRNYRDHVAEAGLKLPDFPSVFLRMHDSLAAPGRPLVRPRISEQFDYEGEVALVIGKGGRHIAPENAFDHVFGYTAFNDGSVRDVQLKHSLVAGKNFHASGSFGPAIVTIDEVPDPAAISVETRLNGATVQNAALKDLIFDIPYLISYISAFTPLSPGDVISTGTPEGVGLARNPPSWLKPGDVVEISVTGVGTLTNTVINEQ